MSKYLREKGHEGDVVETQGYCTRLEMCTLSSTQKFRNCSSRHVTGGDVSKFHCRYPGIRGTHCYPKLITSCSGTKGHCCDNVSPCHCCEPEMALVTIEAVVLQQLPQFTLSQFFVLTMVSLYTFATVCCNNRTVATCHAGCQICRKNATDRQTRTGL